MLSVVQCTIWMVLLYNLLVSGGPDVDIFVYSFGQLKWNCLKMLNGIVFINNRYCLKHSTPIKCNILTTSVHWLKGLLLFILIFIINIFIYYKCGLSIMLSPLFQNREEHFLPWKPIQIVDEFLVSNALVIIRTFYVFDISFMLLFICHDFLCCWIFLLLFDLLVLSICIGMVCCFELCLEYN